MAVIKERESTHIYHVNRMSKEEMDRMVNLCVYEQPAYCVAACPMKLDTREFLKHMAAGNLKKALAQYEKITPFPVILSSGCEAPCEGVCKLCSLGEGVSIKEIERACAKFGERTKSSGVFRMRKKKKAAILGNDLFCLFLAGELERKMYPTTIYCEQETLADYLKAAAPFLSEEEHAAEYARLKSMDLSFEFGKKPGEETWAACRESYDVVCCAKKIAQEIWPEAVFDDEIMMIEEKRLVSAEGSRVMQAAMNAKQAALTVDRLAQNLSPRNNRTLNEAVETKLYTSLEGVSGSSRVPMGEGGYTAQEAVEEAGRCIQCRCEECFKGCEYLKHYKKHPALLAREIYNNTQIIMGDHPMNLPMNSCSLCGQCTVTCPNGFDMSRVCKMARENMVSTDKMPLATHEFALLDMLFSNQEAFLARSQPGFAESKYVFFPGCQASAISPATVKAAYLDLTERLDGGVGLMLGCCGAICDWAGRYELEKETKDQIDDALAKLGNPIVIAGCPTCMKELSAHENVQVVGIWEILEEIGLPKEAQSFEMPAAIHDACGARGNEDAQKSIRRLAESLGVTLVETKLSGDKSPCCGYGGLTSYANREVAAEMTRKCTSQTEAPLITYCMACKDRFARDGHTSRHILELVYGTEAGNPPDISEKRYNRLKLMQELLKEVWDEDIHMKTREFTISYTEEALAMMDDRMILKSDVEAVLSEYKENGEAIFDETTGELLARSRLGNVTFWVRFTETEDGYRVVRAYSHRMNIVKRVGQ